MSNIDENKTKPRLHEIQLLDYWTAEDIATYLRRSTRFAKDNVCIHLPVHLIGKTCKVHKKDDFYHFLERRKIDPGEIEN